jgi:Xaa-Pro aminopeptidase
LANPNIKFTFANKNRENVASKKIYFDEEEGSRPAELQIYFNNRDRLYVSIEDSSDDYAYNFLTLSLEDAEEIVLSLTEQIKLIKSKTEI